MKALRDRGVWFVTGSQHLYGVDALATVAANARRIAGALDGAPTIVTRVVPKPVVTTAEAIHELPLGATATPSCVGIIAWMHTFSPARMWIAGLTALKKPLLQLHTSRARPARDRVIGRAVTRDDS